MNESALAAQTRRRQTSAADPEASAWVSANAGSGKTHVLIQRVLRLLLAGASPSKILCLTYTKAAAANMAGRVFRKLSEWTSLGDEELTKAIVDCGVSQPTAADLTLARRLFAHTIETPGGLKIQTLHAFCERLLKLFPFEANVAAHFKVLEERDQIELMEEARASALRAMLDSPQRAATLDWVARAAGMDFETLQQSALGLRETFEAFDAPRFSVALRRALGLGADTTLAEVEREIVGGPESRAIRATWARGLARGKKTDQKMAGALLGANAPQKAGEQVERLLSAFFTKDGAGTPLKRNPTLATKDLAKEAPQLEEALCAEQDRLETLRETWRTATTCERTENLFAVAGPILGAYARLKGERGFLDFEDQIERALALVTRVSAAWVMHKLDYGFDHILIDEAQDTSADQWRIVEALSEDLFAGASARPRERTVFAVGDEKQSIFSFQGAAPEKFAAMRSRFARGLTQAERPFRQVQLHVSFRSAKAILEAVDATFKNPAAWRGVSADPLPPTHEAFRADLPGVVELWPVLSPPRCAGARGLADAARRTLARRSRRQAGEADRERHRRLARAAVARTRRRTPRPRASDPSGRRDDPGAQARRVFRGDDPGAEGRGRQGGGRRSPDPARPHRGHGPRRGGARLAHARRRPFARVGPQIALHRSRRRGPSRASRRAGRARSPRRSPARARRAPSPPARGLQSGEIGRASSLLTISMRACSARTAGARPCSAVSGRTPAIRSTSFWPLPWRMKAARRRRWRISSPRSRKTKRRSSATWRPKATACGC